MKNVNKIFKYAGVICIPLYVIFTFISHLYNTKINPVTNWLSDFGNPIENPSGAVFYNMGCIVVAIMLVVFYIGICQWYKGFKIAKKYVICYVIAQISGIIASISLVFAAIFPLGTNNALHSAFSTVNMLGMDFFLSFTAIALFLNPNIKKWIAIFGYASAVFNIITMNAFSSFYISEWIYFTLFMIYAAIITVNYDKIMQCEIRPAKQNSGGNSGNSIKV